MNTYAVSLIRTVVPLLVGWLLSLPIVPAVLHGLAVTDTATVSAAATAILTAAYYAAARALEHRFPAFGVLLGVPAAPTYPTAAAPTTLQHTEPLPVIAPKVPAPATDEAHQLLADLGFIPQ